ncbi:hypothetical protein SAMN05421881_10919, partial [Nitrosomonas halophila]
RDLRVQRLPQKTLLLYSVEQVCCSLLIYKGALVHQFFVMQGDLLAAINV